MGEISLSGANRPAPQAVLRMKEAARLGFDKAVSAPLAKESDADTGLMLDAYTRLDELVVTLAQASAANQASKPHIIDPETFMPEAAQL